MARREDRYVISVAAKLAGVHPQTLRFYERRGLITPERTPGGSRRYSDADIARLCRIQELTAEGLSLAGVERYFEMERRFETARAEVARLRQVVDELRREHRRELVPVRDVVDFFAPRNAALRSRGSSGAIRFPRGNHNVRAGGNPSEIKGKWA